MAASGAGIDIKVKASSDMRDLAKRLKAEGDSGKKLRADFIKALKEASAPAAEAVAKSAEENLPKSGGLNQWVAAAAVTSKVRTTGNRAGVRVTAKPGTAKRKRRKKGDAKPAPTAQRHDLDAIDRGKVRHPTFGHRAKGDWHDQEVKPKFFTAPLDAMAPELQRRLVKVIDDMKRRLGA